MKVTVLFGDRRHSKTETASVKLHACFRAAHVIHAWLIFFCVAAALYFLLGFVATPSPDITPNVRREPASRGLARLPERGR